MQTELGHQQPPTMVITDNAVAEGIVNKTLKQQKSKAMDMRYHWIQDRIEQNQFQVKWAPGEENKGDLYTKHHSTPHHKAQRPRYIHDTNN